MRNVKIDLPEWLIEKLRNNDQKIDEDQFGRLKYYYKQLTGLKLKKRCQNCIDDAFIVLKIYLKNQAK